MKILRVITRLPPGGIERRLVALLPLLRERGVEAEVCCVHEKGGLASELEARGVPVHFRRMKSRLHPAGLRALAALMREGNYDLVHSHMYRSNVPATVAARLAGVPILGQVHNLGTWETRRQLWQDRFLSRWRLGMLAPSRRVADEVRERLRLPPERVHVIYNGVDVERFAPDAAKRADTREALGLGADDVAFLCPARLHPQKNHAGLLEAFAQAELPPSAALLLAGDGTERASLEALADSLGLPRGATLAEARKTPGGAEKAPVAFLGHRDDMEALCSASDAMALASFKEGFSNAVVEALAAGLPVIATDVGGNAEALGDDVSERPGAIVEGFEPAGFAQAMRPFALDPGLRAKASARALERAKLFSLGAMADATAALYEKALREAAVQASR